MAADPLWQAAQIVEACRRLGGVVIEPSKQPRSEMGFTAKPEPSPTKPPGFWRALSEDDRG